MFLSNVHISKVDIRLETVSCITNNSHNNFSISYSLSYFVFFINIDDRFSEGVTPLKCLPQLFVNFSTVQKLATLYLVISFLRKSFLRSNSFAPNPFVFLEIHYFSFKSNARLTSVVSIRKKYGSRVVMQFLLSVGSSGARQDRQFSNSLRQVACHDLFWEIAHCSGPAILRDEGHRRVRLTRKYGYPEVPHTQLCGGFCRCD